MLVPFCEIFEFGVVIGGKNRHRGVDWGWEGVLVQDAGTILRDLQGDRSGHKGKKIGTVVWIGDGKVF